MYGRCSLCKDVEILYVQHKKEQSLLMMSISEERTTHTWKQ